MNDLPNALAAPLRRWDHRRTTVYMLSPSRGVFAAAEVTATKAAATEW